MGKTSPNGWYLKDGILAINVFFVSIAVACLNLRLKIKDIGLVWLPTSDLLSNYLQSSGRQENGDRWNYPRLNLPAQSDLGANMSPQFDWGQSDFICQRLDPLIFWNHIRFYIHSDEINWDKKISINY